jgi:hypothetical protein
MKFIDQYNGAVRMEKCCVAESILGIVKHSNARFLKKNSEGAWEEVDEVTAREKVAHTFRNLRKQQVLDQKRSLRAVPYRG